MKKKEAPLSGKVKEIILGSLLGDGSLKIHNGYRNARFSFRHSNRQRSYFLWKVDLLSEIAAPKSVIIQPPDGYSQYEKLRFQSCALPALSEIYTLTHKARKFRIRRKWLNQMSALSLAIWWFDDGSLISNSRKGVFCTDGFGLDAQKIIRQYLKVAWDIDVHIGKVKKKRDSIQEEYFRLWLRSTEELKRFLRIILPFTQVEELLPKVILLYREEELQQRWISEIEQLTLFSRSVIEKYVDIKKKKWKAFRE